MLVGGIAVANKDDIDQHAVDAVCTLNSNSGVTFRYFMCKKVLECLMFVC
ncbi:Protein lines [Gossypium arboreum]|uniref:Protein lines n=1 Tax=Gossypium arboreum TaxID=29729 RepID=A0A0B0P2E3_GOSAR|nr:Protein lines [Gossypium arboreum]